MRRAASCALALVALAAGCGGDGGEEDDQGSDSKRVIAAVIDYAHAFGRGDGEKACSLLTPAGRDRLEKRVSSLVGGLDCPQAVERVAEVAGPNVTGPFREAEAAGANVTGDSATATLTAAGHTTEVTLEKVDGEWLLARAPGL